MAKIKLTPEVKTFWKWVNERHDIYLRRKRGEKPPWTRDPILREYKFTNVFRELDRVTQELHTRLDPLGEMDMPLPDRLYRIILFRAFNWAPTYDLIDGYRAASSARRMKHVLHKAAGRNEKIFTGAYIVTNAGSTEPKIDVMCDALAVTFRGRQRLWEEIEKNPTMEGATRAIMQYPMMGAFTSYEVVCDLRYQKGMLLEDAQDRLTWANLGPGAKRGINRLVGGDKRPHVFKKTEEYVQFMRDLLEMGTAVKHGTSFWKHSFDTPLEMREIEHSLCEVDKYLRVKTGEGRPRSKFYPTP